MQLIDDVNVIMFLLLMSFTVIFKCFVMGFDEDAIMYPEDDDYKTKNHFHNHKYPGPNSPHDPEFHRNHPHLPYPGQGSNFHNHHHHHHHSLSEETFESSNLSSIPLEFMLKYNNFAEVNDILHNLVEGNIQDQNEQIILEARFGNQRSAAVTPKTASCIPELQTVHIAPTDDPTVLYIPTCTRIERCGGCCSHSLLSCQPTSTETVSFQLVKTQFHGGSKLKYVGKEIVTVERHTKCKCSCKVQAKHCNQFQEYRNNECSCACTNRDEEKKCDKEISVKLWNPEICSCQCRNIVQCSTGYHFDTIRCKCMPVLLRRRYAELYVTEPILPKPGPLPVVPLEEVDDENN